MGWAGYVPLAFSPWLLRGSGRLVSPLPGSLSLKYSLVLYLPASSSDQDHLDKEIDKLRKQLKVKVNRLFEAQGIDLGELGVRRAKN